MSESEVNLRVNESGADRATAALDRVSNSLGTVGGFDLKIQRLGSALMGVGQVSRLIGGDFDKLGESISKVGMAAQGLAALGSVFGPIGTMIGAVSGAVLGLVNLLRGASAETTQAATAQKQVQNNLSFNIDISAQSIGEARRELDREIDAILRQRQAFGTGGMMETTSVVERSGRYR